MAGSMANARPFPMQERELALPSRRVRARRPRHAKVRRPSTGLFAAVTASGLFPRTSSRDDDRPANVSLQRRPISGCGFAALVILRPQLNLGVGRNIVRASEPRPHLYRRSYDT
jgi:hypothetical protein